MNRDQAATATLDELRDWCAGDDGWMRIEQAERISHDEWWKWTINATHGGKTWCMHPHPPTLDGAAAALPKDVYWEKSDCDCCGKHEGYRAYLVRGNQIITIDVFDTGNEILARYRLALACRLAEMGGAE